jgi:hypothetical protein
MARTTQKSRKTRPATTTREYRFKIDAYSPETMPLNRLVEYLDNLAVLFGENHSVHLVKIEKGSTVPVISVRREAEQKVRERLRLVRQKDGPSEALRAEKQINELLRRDDAQAVIVDPVGSKLVDFPGRELNRLVEYGPFNQPGTLDGVPIMIGGEEDTVPIHLEGRQKEIYICRAKRSVAIELAPYIFSKCIRVEGNGRWIRHRDGEWEMKRFTIKSFSILEERSLRETIEDLRAVPAKWKSLPDPYSQLAKIRRGA